MANPVVDYLLGRDRFLSMGSEERNKLLDEHAISPEQFQIKQDLEYKPGIIEGTAHNILGMGESVTGGLANAIGTTMKGYSSGEDSLAYKIGEGLTNNGDWLEGLGAKEARRYGTTPENQKLNLWQALTTPSYYSMRGIGSDITQGIGSTLPSMALAYAAAHVPVIGPVLAKGSLALGAAGRAVAGKAGQAAVRAGAGLLRKSPLSAGATRTGIGIMKDAGQALGENLLTMGGVSALTEVTSDSAENKEFFYNKGRELGYKGTELDKYAANEIIKQAIDELPATVLADTITGAFVSGKGGSAMGIGSKSVGRRAAANTAALGIDMTGEGWQEVAQTIASEIARGEPHGDLLDPTTWNEAEMAAFRGGSVGAVGFGGVGAVKNTILGGMNNRKFELPNTKEENDAEEITASEGEDAKPTDSITVNGGVDVRGRRGSDIVEMVRKHLKGDIPSDWLYAQMYHETGGFDSDLADNHHNYSGMKVYDEETETAVPGGTPENDGTSYRHFNSDEEYARAYANLLNQYAEYGVFDANNIDEFARALKRGGWYDDLVPGNDEEEIQQYINGMKGALGDSASTISGRRPYNYANSIDNGEVKINDWNPAENPYAEDFDNLVQNGTPNTAEEYLKFVDDVGAVEDKNKAVEALESKDQDKMEEIAKELGYGRGSKMPEERIMAQAATEGKVTFSNQEAAQAFERSPLGKDFKRVGDTSFTPTEGFNEREDVKAFLEKLNQKKTGMPRMNPRFYREWLAKQKTEQPEPAMPGPIEGEEIPPPTDEDAPVDIQTEPAPQETQEAQPTPQPAPQQTEEQAPQQTAEPAPAPQEEAQQSDDMFNGWESPRVARAGKSMLKAAEKGNLLGNLSPEALDTALNSNKPNSILGAAKALAKKLKKAGVDIRPFLADETDGVSPMQNEVEAGVGKIIDDFKQTINTISVKARENELTIAEAQQQMVAQRQKYAGDVAKYISSEVNKGLINNKEGKYIAEQARNEMDAYIQQTLQDVSDYINNQVPMNEPIQAEPAPEEQEETSPYEDVIDPETGEVLKTAEEQQQENKPTEETNAPEEQGEEKPAENKPAEETKPAEDPKKLFDPAKLINPLTDEQVAVVDAIFNHSIKPVEQGAAQNTTEGFDINKADSKDIVAKYVSTMTNGENAQKEASKTLLEKAPARQGVDFSRADVTITAVKNGAVFTTAEKEGIGGIGYYVSFDDNAARVEIKKAQYFFAKWLEKNGLSQNEHKVVYNDNFKDAINAYADTLPESDATKAKVVSILEEKAPEKQTMGERSRAEVVIDMLNHGVEFAAQNVRNGKNSLNFRQGYFAGYNGAQILPVEVTKLQYDFANWLNGKPEIGKTPEPTNASETKPAEEMSTQEAMDAFNEGGIIKKNLSDGDVNDILAIQQKIEENAKQKEQGENETKPAEETKPTDETKQVETTEEDGDAFGAHLLRVEHERDGVISGFERIVKNAEGVKKNGIKENNGGDNVESINDLYYKFSQFMLEYPDVAEKYPKIADEVKAARDKAIKQISGENSTDAGYNGENKPVKGENEDGRELGKSESVSGGPESVQSGEVETDTAGEQEPTAIPGKLSGQSGQEGVSDTADNAGAVNREESDGEPVGTGRNDGEDELDTPASEGTGTGGNQSVSPQLETPGHDYEFTGASSEDKTSSEVRFRQNIAAIKLLKQLEAENRMPTPSEQQILAEYNGWGSLSNAFNTGNKMNKELRELLTDDEYKSVRSTMTDAYFTSPDLVKAIWKGVSHLGFKGGRILDPSMGTGNFFGCMPREMMKRSDMQGVELDSITSRIAKQLYPSAAVENNYFQRAKLPGNYYDLVISNVPFGSNTVQGYKIHNYYFANGIDKVRPGGLMVYITSQGSLAGSGDAAKMRSYLARTADLIGAFKLPKGTFKEAGTDVITDIVIFRKHDEGGARSPHAQDFSQTDRKFNSSINKYFLDHPENVLGEMRQGKDGFGNAALTVKENEGENIAEALEKAITSLPANVYTKATKAKSKTFDNAEAIKAERAKEETREREYYERNGKVYQNVDGKEIPITGPKTLSRVKSYLGVKKALKELSLAQKDPTKSDSEVESLRAKLNSAYNAFVRKHGYLSDKDNKRAFIEDIDAGAVLSLEKAEYTGKGNNRNVSKVTKADIFTKRTVQAVKEVTKADNASDALLASLNNAGYVDLDYMAKLIGSTPESIASQLKGTIFKNPVTEGYEPREEYLSGNVREKLEQAKKAAEKDDSYSENVSELEKIVPHDLVSDEIIVNMGSSWIPKSDLQDFFDNILGRNGGLSFAQISSTGKWQVSGWANTQKYRVDGLDFSEFVQNILNNSPIVVYVGKKSDKIIDKESTDAANATADRLKEDFTEWLWSDKERAKRLIKSYNEQYNSTVLREYDGSHLTFPGMNSNIKLKPHQKNAVWRMLQNGNTLIAHCVGAGKTFEMQAAGMEMRRLGIAKKPLYCLPNNIVEQFAREFRLLYPSQDLKLLVLTSKDLPATTTPTDTEKSKHGISGNKWDFSQLSKEDQSKILEKRAERTSILARIQSEDWDGIIISHGLFERLPLSPETAAEFINEEIENTRRAVEESKGAHLGGRAQRALEERLKTLQDKLEDVLSTDLEDIGIPFEELGVDQIFVDEADMFKNLHYATAMERVAGLPNSNANRSTDMYAKTRWLTRTHGGRGVVFATGTPISNTFAEMYTMMRYLDLQGLKEKGLDLFDNWIRTFAKIGIGIERKPTGDGFRQVSKVLNIINCPDLIRMFRKFTDVKTQDELDLDVPKLKNGKPTIVTIPADPVIVDYIKNEVPARVAEIKSTRPGTPGADNMLKLIGDLRKLSMNDAKIEACASVIAKKFNETMEQKGAQLVFCDMGIPRAEKDDGTSETDANSKNKSDEEQEAQNASVYQKLIAALKRKGIPASQIGFIQSAKNKQQMDEMFQKVDRGELRILIGSTQKMGAGTNCQHKLVAEHDLDAPWRPRDLDQRHGRIVRQGNENSEVEIFNYVVKDSYDANMWERLKGKAEVIAKALSGNLTDRIIEDLDLSTLTYGEIEGAATGNPLIKKRLELSNEVTKLGNAEVAYKRRISQAERDLEKIPSEISAVKDRIKKYERDSEERKSTAGENFSIKIGGTTYSSRKEADSALSKALYSYRDRTFGKIGEIAGFSIQARQESAVIVDGEMLSNNVELQLVRHGIYDVKTPSVQGLEYAAANAPLGYKLSDEKSLKAKEERLQEANEILTQPSPYAEKLKKAKNELAEIDAQIEADLLRENKAEVEGVKKREEAEKQRRETNRRKYSASDEGDLTQHDYIPRHKLTTTEKIITDAARKLGIILRYVDVPAKPGSRGVFFNGNGIVLNRQANVEPRIVVFHELTHWLKEQNPEVYNELRKAVNPSTERINAYRKHIFEGRKKDAEVIVEEMIADAVAKSDARYKLMQQMINSNRSLGMRVVGTLLNAWHRIKDAFNTLIGKNPTKALPFGLNAKEIDRINTELNKAICSLKSEGKTIFMMKDGQVVNAETGTLASLFSYASEDSATGEKLLAPNGKPSNLTPEQYRQVRTPAFKKWFGDWENDPENASKVVDENGEPLVMYHGTTRGGFNTFNSGFFTDDRTVSEWYAGTGEVVHPKDKFIDTFIARKPIADVVKFIKDELGREYKKASQKEILSYVKQQIDNEGKSYFERMKESISNTDRSTLSGVQQELYDLAKENLKHIQNISDGNGRFSDVQAIFNNQEKKMEIAEGADNPLKEIRFIRNTLGDNGFALGTLKESLDGYVSETDPYLRNETHLRDTAREYALRNAEHGVYEVFLNIRNPLIMDAGGQGWRGLTLKNDNGDTLASGSTDKIAEYAKGEGYDGVIIKRVNDMSVEDYHPADDYVPFNPTQIKSATDNIGTFDSGNPDIRYSADADPEANSKSTLLGSIKTWALKKALNALKKQGMATEDNVEVITDEKPNSPGPLDELFRSPTRLAKSFPQFKYVVDLAEKAATAQDKMRAAFVDAMNEVNDHLAEGDFEKNWKVLEGILWTGDAEHKNFTDEELRALGKDENVIKAYRKLRDTLEEAWNMVNDVYQKAITETKTISGAEYRELLAGKDPFKKVIKATKLAGKDQYTVVTRRPKTVVKTEIVSEQELENLKNDPDVYFANPDEDIKEYKQNFTVKKGEYGLIRGGRFYEVTYERANPKLGHTKGYVPHIFHDFFVTQKVEDKKGNVIGYNILGSAESLAEASKKANEIAKANPSAQIMITPKRFQFPNEANQAAVMGDMDYFNVMNKTADQLSITASEAEKLLNDSLRMKNRGRFMDALMERVNVEGYDKENTRKVLQMYFNQVGRYCALDDFKRKSINFFEQNYGDFTSTRLSREANIMRNYINDFNGNPTEWEIAMNECIKSVPILKQMLKSKAGGRPSIALAHLMTHPASIAKLGLLNVSSALINLTQLFNFAGALDAGAGKGWKYLQHGIKEYYKVFPATGEGNARLKKFLMEDLGLRYTMNLAESNSYSKQDVCNKLLGKSFVLFRKMDQIARGATLLGAYKKAKDSGMSHQEAIKYAREIDHQVNFEYNVFDAPGMFRRYGPAGMVAFQFQKYPIKQLEFFFDLLQRGYKRGGKIGAVKEFSKYTFPYFICAGMYGTPFLGIIGAMCNGIVSCITGDDDWDWETEMKKMLYEKYGKDSKFVQSVLYGAGSLVGVNIGQRVGIGDYGSTLFSNGFSDGGNRGAVGKIMSSTVMGATFEQAYANYLHNGFFSAETFKAISPAIGGFWQAVNGEAKTTLGRKKYEYDPYDRILRAAGITPINERVEGDMAGISYYDRKKGRSEKQDAIEKFLDAEASRDKAKINKAFAKIQELGISPAAVKQEREKRNKTKTERDEARKPAKPSKPKEYKLKDYQ